jgi:calcineurin-like phosphoesterase family protein
VLEQGYDLQFCGHVHERWTVKGKAINVGVDRWNYTPVGLDNLVVMAKALILNRP